MESVSKLEKKLDKATQKTIAALEKGEKRLWSKVSKIDSSKGKDGMQESKERYSTLKERLKQKETAVPSEYLPFLDTLKTSLNFFSANQDVLKNAKGTSEKLSSSLNSVNRLQNSIQWTEELKSFIKNRKFQLKEQLQGLPVAEELNKLNKQAYYYTAQVAEFKALLNDRKKVEHKALELLSKSKLFQDFMSKNSQLAALFPMPADADDIGGSVSLQGLQTRSSIQQTLQNRFGSGTDVTHMLQENVGQAQAQLNELKSKAAQYSSGAFGNSSSDVQMPDGFKPNDQKTKPFLKRLEWGGNMQSQRARQFFPVSSDLGFSIGYKVNDKSVVGLGASYKLGWGRGWNHIALSHQGVGLRSYVDIKLKGSIYISGGYEQNYRSAFQTIDVLKNYSAWQSSGLLGLTKKYAISKKVRGNMQLLWDFLSYHQLPKTQAIVWRVGYTLK